MRDASCCARLVWCIHTSISHSHQPNCKLWEEECSSFIILVPAHSWAKILFRFQSELSERSNKNLIGPSGCRLKLVKVEVKFHDSKNSGPEIQPLAAGADILERLIVVRKLIIDITHTICWHPCGVDQIVPPSRMISPPQVLSLAERVSSIFPLCTIVWYIQSSFKTKTLLDAFLPC